MPYVVIDKTPDRRCTGHIREEYGPLMANIIRDGRVVDGDAFVIRNSLQEAGFVWGQDFYIKKADSPATEKTEGKRR